nr:cortex morphogenetic protein CmpA [Desulfuribacillus alkaliarsenatis]
MILLPNWLLLQLRKAFYQRDKYQIKMLNKCWFRYK